MADTCGRGLEEGSSDMANKGMGGQLVTGQRPVTASTQFPFWFSGALKVLLKCTGET